jgi:lysozyme
MAKQNSSWSEAIEIATQLCIIFEGVYLRPYMCPAGKATIGVGATFYENGVAVSMSDPAITNSRAKELLQFQLRRVFLPGVLRLCPEMASESPRRIAAILDFAFNTGLGRLQTSTLRRKLRALDWEGAKEQLALWVRGGGRVLPGLVKRRAAESALLG